MNPLSCKRQGSMRPKTVALFLLLLATTSLLPIQPSEAHSRMQYGSGDHKHYEHTQHDNRRMRGVGSGFDQGGIQGGDPDDADPPPVFWVGDHAFRDEQAFRDSGARCAQKDPTSAEMDAADAAHARWRRRQGLTAGKTISSLKRTAVNVDTYIHVVTYGTFGDVSNETIAAQMAVLNDAYDGLFNFVQIGSPTRTDDYFWWTAQPNTAEELEMKTALRRGGPDALNIYFTAPSGGLLGWATFPPWYYMENGEKNDGVVVLHSTVPLGSSGNYNEGDTLVHEVGHWLGLYHTFHVEQGEDSCTGKGDRVHDTPAQSSPTFGCPAEGSIDTCPNEDGTDLVENYMNYSDDRCMYSFTAEQQERMAAMWDEFRSLSSNDDDDALDDDIGDDDDDSFLTTDSPSASPSTSAPTSAPTTTSPRTVSPTTSAPSPTPPSPTPPSPTPPSPTPPSSERIYVSLLTAQKRSCSNPEEDCWLSRVHVSVEGVDSEGGEDARIASGVIVSGWYRGAGRYSSVQCTTGTDGTCYVPAFRSAGGGRSRIRFQVKELSKPGAIYDMDRNDMTFLNILKP